MFIVIAPLLELDNVELADASSHTQDGTTAVQESSPISIQVLRIIRFGSINRGSMQNN